MKLVAYILIVSLGLLGMNRFMELPHEVMHPVEHSGTTDCCCDHEDDCQSGSEKDTSHACHGECDCSCCFHITGITYQFISVPVATVQTYIYGDYINDYYFEFTTPLFQPPRMG